MNENVNTIYQKLWDAANAVLAGKFIAVNTYTEKETISNNQPNSTPQEKRKKNKLKFSRKRGNNNQSRNKQNREQKTLENVNEIKSQLFEKIYNTDKSLAGLRKKDSKTNKQTTRELKILEMISQK